jgi:hypothetical protein
MLPRAGSFVTFKRASGAVVAFFRDQTLASLTPTRASGPTASDHLGSRRIRRQLRVGPGGRLAGRRLATAMYFSHNDDHTTGLSLLERAGLKAERAAVVDQDDADARFLRVVARKPI